MRTLVDQAGLQTMLDGAFIQEARVVRYPDDDPYHAATSLDLIELRLVTRGGDYVALDLGAHGEHTQGWLVAELPSGDES